MDVLDDLYLLPELRDHLQASMRCVVDLIEELLETVGRQSDEEFSYSIVLIEIRLVTILIIHREDMDHVPFDLIVEVLLRKPEFDRGGCHLDAS